MGQLQVPAGVPQAKHKRRYSLQALRQLDINNDQSGATRTNKALAASSSSFIIVKIYSAFD
jgi:hypothetical protein